MKNIGLKGLMKRVSHIPQRIVTVVGGDCGYLSWMSDAAYIRLQYYTVFGKWPDLKNPQTFNEKVQWLKLHDRNPLYKKLVDKYEVKRYVENILGPEYIIPTLGIWDFYEEIDFDILPDQFVLKCTHDSGSIVICKDKKNFDHKNAKKKLDKALKVNYYYHSREWAYKGVKPRIIAEQFMVDESGFELKDYKIYTFNGIPKLIQVDFGRYTTHKRNLYTVNWEYIDASIKFPADKQCVIERPKRLDEMLWAAEKLSEGIPHVRTDFYSIDEHIYFGEMTLYHGSGLEKFAPEELGKKMGEWIKLSGDCSKEKNRGIINEEIYNND